MTIIIKLCDNRTYSRGENIMGNLLERSDQALPITELSRSSKKIIDHLGAGESDKYVVMRNNIPAAVLMSVPYYEELMDLIDDLNLELVASQRLASLDSAGVLTHEEMLKKFESTH